MEQEGDSEKATTPSESSITIEILSGDEKNLMEAFKKMGSLYKPDGPLDMSGTIEALMNTPGFTFGCRVQDPDCQKYAAWLLLSMFKKNADLLREIEMKGRGSVVTINEEEIETSVKPDMLYGCILSLVNRYRQTSRVPRFVDAGDTPDSSNDWASFIRTLRKDMNDNIKRRKDEKIERETSKDTTPLTPLTISSAVFYFVDGHARFPEICPLPGKKQDSGFWKKIAKRLVSIYDENFETGQKKPDEVVKIFQTHLQHQAIGSSYLQNLLERAVPSYPNKSLGTLMDMAEVICLNSRKYAFGTDWGSVFEEWSKPEMKIRRIQDPGVLERAFEHAKKRVNDRLEPLYQVIEKYSKELNKQNPKDVTSIFFGFIDAFSSEPKEDLQLTTTRSSQGEEISLTEWSHVWAYGRGKIKEKSVVTWLKKIQQNWEYDNQGRLMAWNDQKGFLAWFKKKIEEQTEMDVKELFLDTPYLTFTRQITPRVVAETLFIPFKTDKGETRYRVLADLDWATYDGDARPIFYELKLFDELGKEEALRVAEAIAQHFRRIFGLLQEDADIWQPLDDNTDNNLAFKDFGWEVGALKDMEGKMKFRFSDYLNYYLDAYGDDSIPDPVSMFHILFWIIKTDFGYYASPRHPFRALSKSPIICIDAAIDLASKTHEQRLNGDVLFMLDLEPPSRNQDVPWYETSGAPDTYAGEQHSPYPLLDYTLVGQAPSQMLEKIYLLLRDDDESNTWTLMSHLREFFPGRLERDFQLTLLIDPITSPLFRNPEVTLPENISEIFKMTESLSEEGKGQAEAGNKPVVDMIKALEETRQAFVYEGQHYLWDDETLFEELVTALTMEDVKESSQVVQTLLPASKDKITVLSLLANRAQFEVSVLNRVGVSFSMTESLLVIQGLFYQVLQMLLRNVTYPEDAEQVYPNVENFFKKKEDEMDEGSLFTAARFDYKKLPEYSHLTAGERDYIIKKFDAATEMNTKRPMYRAFIDELTTETSTLRSNQAFPEIGPVGQEPYAIIGKLLLLMQRYLSEKYDAPTGQPWANFSTLFENHNYCFEFVMMSRTFAPQQKPEEATEVRSFVLDIGDILEELLLELRESFYAQKEIYIYLQCIMYSWMIKKISKKISDLMFPIPTFAPEVWMNACDEAYGKQNSHPVLVTHWLGEKCKPGAVARESDIADESLKPYIELVRDVTSNLVRLEKEYAPVPKKSKDDDEEEDKNPPTTKTKTKTTKSKSKNKK